MLVVMIVMCVHIQHMAMPYFHILKYCIYLHAENDKPEGCKHDGPQQPMPEHVQPKG